MATGTYPQFGVSGGFSSVTQSTKIDDLELAIGNTVMRFQKSMNIECSSTETLCDWGMAKPNNATLVYDAFSLMVIDELEPVVTLGANQQQASIVQDKVLTSMECCKVLKSSVIISLEGKGDPQWLIGDTTPPPSDIKSAIGTFDPSTTITGITGKVGYNPFYLSDYSTEATDNEWLKFKAEWKFTIPVVGGHAATLVKATIPCNTNTKEGIANFCTTYKYNIKMSSKGYVTITSTMVKTPKVN